ncbi:MAG: Fe-S cluster assembly ATPase SufC [Chloroflexota bacterium]
MNTANPTLVIEGLRVAVEGKEILRGLDLTVNRGETHALMGPNGSGKSTLANTLMGHPRYEVLSGSVRLDGEEMLGLGPDKRAQKGLFLAFQYPVAIPGVRLGDFLRAATRATQTTQVSALEFRKRLRGKMDMLKMDQAFAARDVNEGFSGGEKKRAEVLQMAMLEPSIAVLDEIDSGLDIDALRTVAEGVEALAGPEMGLLVITHYQRLLNYIHPDHIHVLVRGRIVASGGVEIVEKLEAEGYESYMQDLPSEELAEQGAH